MRRVLNSIAIVAGLSSYMAAQVPNEPTLKEFFDTHRWFELRDAAKGRRLPALYSGALASAFNRTHDAETFLNAAIRGASGIAAANEARMTLAVLYLRVGRTADASRLIDDILATAPDRPDIHNIRLIFGAFPDRPNQRVRFRRSTVHCEVGHGIRIPLSVNGHPVNWLFDTGANITTMSDAEARTLGLVVRDPGAENADLAGGTAHVRIARIESMLIGGTEIRDVPAIVFPASQPPWNDLPSGQQGIVGLPVALALRSIRWTKAGTCDIGATIGAAAIQTPLAFNDFNVVARVATDGRPLDFILDTGNEKESELWERFARDFAGLLKERGTTGTRRITQIGGTAERQVTILPDLRFRIGGIDAAMRPAYVFSKPVGNEWYHGNLGMDVLNQGSEVAIDFQSMTLALR